MTERLHALTIGNPWDFRYENDPKCPHCGYACKISDNEWYGLYEEGEHEVECPLCELVFSVSTTVSYSFSTDNQEDL